jgi:hypothetical protein
MSGNLAYLSMVLQDTRLLESEVGRTISPIECSRIFKNLQDCRLPYSDVPAQGKYYNFLNSVGSGLPVSWSFDIQTIRDFREEVIRYIERVKIKQRNSPSKLSHIRLTED